MESPEFGPMLVALAGGLALFLYGIHLLTESLKVVAGDGMRAILAKLTTNRFTGAFAGALVTSVIQSSSVTTVLVVGFVSAGLMNLSQVVPVILGANIGTTVTAQVIAFKITRAAMVLIAVGFFCNLVARSVRAKQLGLMILGLGLLFFGMEQMSLATSPLRTWGPFIDLMQRMDHPAWGLAIGAAFTALVQSSSATTGVVIVLAAQGVLSLEAGIALIFGANVGTCVTGLLAAIGKPVAAKQAAAVHVIFNLAGVVMAVSLIPELADLVRRISPARDDLASASRLAAEMPRQIANAHTVFNVANTLIFLPLTGALAEAVQRIVPDRPAKSRAAAGARYLDPMYLQTPGLALDHVRMELAHLLERVGPMLRSSVRTALTAHASELANVARLDDRVDSLHAEIARYLGRIQEQTLTPSQVRCATEWTVILNAIENLGDTVETNLAGLGRERITRGIRFPDEVVRAFGPLGEEMVETWSRTLAALQGDDEAAEAVASRKAEVTQMADEAVMFVSQRIGPAAGAENRDVEPWCIATDLAEILKRQYYFLKRIARTVIALRGQATLEDEPPGR